MGTALEFWSQVSALLLLGAYLRWQLRRTPLAALLAGPLLAAFFVPAVVRAVAIRSRGGWATGLPLTGELALIVGAGVLAVALAALGMRDGLDARGGHAP